MQSLDPGSKEWTIHQLSKILNPIEKKNPSCSIIPNSKGVKLTHVKKIMCLPLPVGDKGVFSVDSMGFDEWATPDKESANEILSPIIKKIFLMLLISLQQKNIGTPALVKEAFLSKKRWEDYKEWAFPKKATLSNPVNKEAFANNAIDGTTLYDEDIANHYYFLQTETKHLGPTPKKPTVVDPAAAVIIDPIPPVPKDLKNVNPRSKYHVVLQPCRSVNNPDEMAGFLLWVFVEDINYNLDLGRCNFINAVNHYKSELEFKSNAKFAPKTLSQDVISAILEMKFEDNTMLNISHRDWKQWCDIYSFAVKALEIEGNYISKYMDDSGNLKINSSNRKELEEEDDEEDEEEDEYETPAFLSTKGREDELREPSSNSLYSFFSIFTKERAYNIARQFDMDVNHAKDCLIPNPVSNNSFEILIKPSVSSNITIEPSIASLDTSNRSRGTNTRRRNREKKLHPFDNIYYMTQENFYWANSKKGTGLKYCCYPWCNNASVPLFKRVIVDIPSKYKILLGSPILDNSKEKGSISESDLEFIQRRTASASDTNNQQSSSKRNRTPQDTSSSLSDESSLLRLMDLSMTDAPLPRAGVRTPSSRNSEPIEEMDEVEKKNLFNTKIATQKAKVAKKNSYVMTDAIQQDMHKSNLNIENVTINGHYIFKDPEALKEETGSEKISFNFSDIAAKDDIFKVKEIYEGWKNSLARYSFITSVDSRLPKLNSKNQTPFESEKILSEWLSDRKVILNEDQVIYETSSFVSDYIRELANFRNSACESLFRVFRKGGASLINIPTARLAKFYYDNIRNNAKADLFLDLHCFQYNFNESLFAAHIKKQSLNLKYVCEIISNFKEFHIIFYGVMDVYRMAQDTHFNYLGSGEGGVGKSFLLSLLKSVLVRDTVREYFDGSSKSKYTDIPESDEIEIMDELPPFLTGKKDGNNDRFGNTHDPAVNAAKMEISGGQRVYTTFEFVDMGNGDVGRANRRIITHCVKARCVATNLKNGLDAAIRDRFHETSFVNHSKEDVTEKNTHTGDQHPDDDYDKLSVLDLKTQIKSEDTTEFKDVSLSYSCFQTMHMIIEKLIGVGALPSPDMTLMNLIFNKICKYIQMKTQVSIGMRSHNRILNFGRTAVITDATNNAFFACCRDRAVINEKTILCVLPYLFSQVHHAVFIVTLLMDQIFNPYYNCMLYAAIRKIGRFPLKEWVQRLKEKRPITYATPAPTLNTVARQTQNATPSGVTTSEMGVEENVDMQSLLNEEPGSGGNNNRVSITDVTGPSDTGMDVETVGSEEEDERTEPIPQQDHEKACDILKEFFIRDYINNNEHSTIQWKTYDEHVGNGKEKHSVTYVDLNYIEIITSESSSISTLLQDNMAAKISASDINDLMEKMKNLHVRIPNAPRPIMHEELVKSNNMGKLPCYDEKHDFKVIDRVLSTTGGRSYKYFFCVHVITDLTNGENLMLDALKSICYKDFKPRPSLLTGFVKSYEQASLRTISLEPNMKKDKFSCLNAHYRDEETLLLLNSNKFLKSISQGVKIVDVMDHIDKGSKAHGEERIIIQGEDLDDWAAKEWALKSGMPIVWVRKKNDDDMINTTTEIGSRRKIFNPKNRSFDMNDMELKWKYLRADGKIEIRDLPTELNQRRRNLHFIKNDVIDGIKDITEIYLNKAGMEWSDLDADFELNMYPTHIEEPVMSHSTTTPQRH